MASPDDIDNAPDITPDTKNWTWVLERRCPDCGFEASTVEVRSLPSWIRAISMDWQVALTSPDVRRRPSPGVWSTLEYASHVRDVFDLFDRRLALMLAEDDPQFENWDQDATAVEQDYGSQEPSTVSAELAAAGERIADRFAGVRDDQWDRTGRRSDGAVFTVDSFARYFLHDPLHHLWDVEPR